MPAKAPSFLPSPDFFSCMLRSFFAGYGGAWLSGVLSLPAGLLLSVCVEYENLCHGP